MNATELSVRKSITVAAPPERAFGVFTERIGEWWPLRSHSLAGERTQTAVVEGREGGRLYERSVEGEEQSWGTVTAWEPPRRLVVAWHVNPERPIATELEVRFSPEGSGTRVELEHRGFEQYADGAEARASYDGGWDTVLARFADAATA